MTTLERITSGFMLLTGGIWTGVIVAYALERVSLWQRMPLDQYVVDFRRSLPRADPFQPIIAVLCVVAAVVFALDESGTAATLTWLGTGLVVAVIVWSVILMEPLNSRFRRLPEGTVPEGANQIRELWRFRHYVRTAAAVAALACFAAAVGSV